MSAPVPAHTAILSRLAGDIGGGSEHGFGHPDEPEPDYDPDAAPF